MLTPSGEDTWADVADPSARRRVQNRVNQRASRQRKLQEEQKLGLTRRPRGRPNKTSKTTTARGDAAVPVLQATRQRVSDNPFAQILTKDTASTIYTYTKNDDAKRFVTKLMETLSSIILQRLSYGDPSSDLLVHVTTLSSMRGVIYIMGMLDIAVHEMDDENAISSFNSPTATAIARRRVLPESLQPTALQLAVPHHPWIDAFPFPALRDNLMLNAEALAADEGELSDAELCSDTLGLDVNASAGLLLWGDPWDASAWEMSEEFVKKWRWLLGGCDALIASTNYWRESRGEPLLCEDETGS